MLCQIHAASIPKMTLKAELSYIVHLLSDFLAISQRCIGHVVYYNTGNPLSLTVMQDLRLLSVNKQAVFLQFRSDFSNDINRIPVFEIA